MSAGSQQPPYGAWRIVAWRLFCRDLKAGAVWILLLSVALSVMALSVVSLLTERVGLAINQQANQLLAGDAVLRSESPIAPKLLANVTQDSTLRSAQSITLLSMVRAYKPENATQPALGLDAAPASEAASENNQNLPRLMELRAVSADFPLRGEILIRTSKAEKAQNTQRGPVPGTAWLTPAGAANLGLKLDDTLRVGELSLRLAALIEKQPDASLDYFSAAPRLMLALSDMEKTGLLQDGARVTHRLIIAGDTAAVRRTLTRWRGDLQRGQRIETLRNAQPELRRGVQQADRFLSLSALLCVVLAAIAIAMAARRQSARHLDTSAVLRSLGAEQALLQKIFLSQLLLMGLLGSVLGLVTAYAVQWGLGYWLAKNLNIALPAAGWEPALSGIAAGLILLISFALPPILQLKNVPALRVLRRDLGAPEWSASALVLVGLSGISALMIWKAGSWQLGAAILLGVLATWLVLAALALALLQLLKAVKARLRGPLRYGLANAARRPAATIAQASALGLGLMTLLLLGFLQKDLLTQWRNELPPDIANRFLINVQAEQAESLEQFFAERRLSLQLAPVIRGRLIRVNDQQITAQSYREQGQRAQRLAQREFNISTGNQLTVGNRIEEGQFWSTNLPADSLANASATGGQNDAQLSVEIEFAKRLGWQLGDEIEFDIGGLPWIGRITSLRSVKWESFTPNFFVIVNPASMVDFPASYIASFRLDPSKIAESVRFQSALLEQFPNVSVIDLDVIIQQVQQITEQVASALRYVFYLTLIAGVLVLLAAVYASQDERLREGSVLRSLGASSAQLRWAQLSEFLALGLLASGTAVLAANVLTAWIASEVFNLPWIPNFWTNANAALGCTFIVCLAGIWATQPVIRESPIRVLREL